ncbi:hypothetical protein ABZX77_35870 [Streptomyces sp. NPDC004237]|uniref:hypothetical protein n=1 Tax=unclassified Streptomyces TaxID=2593676 RepID=UPI0033AEA356
MLATDQRLDENPTGAGRRSAARRSGLMAGDGQVARGTFRPVYHPAGHDDALRLALEDLQTGRWMSMRRMLADTGTNWALRSSRTQVLAAAAAGSDVVRAWRAEDPANVDAMVMRARVAVERALQAGRRRHPGTEALAQQAREACGLAAHYADPRDPVPWVCLLALAQLDDQQLIADHQWSAPELTLPHGPWGLMQEVYQRDPYNREAHHRMLQFLQVRAGGSQQADALNFAQWVMTYAPPGSALLVLPLHAYAGHYRFQREHPGTVDPLARQQWMREHVVKDVDRALHSWFRHSASSPRALPDLSHLAHALWAAHRFTEAAPVFQAMGRYATRAPWAYVTDRPELATGEFVWARAQCLAAEVPTAAHGRQK